MSNNTQTTINSEKSFIVSDKILCNSPKVTGGVLAQPVANKQLFYLNTKTGTSNAYMNLYFLVKSIQNIAGKYASCRKKRITAGPESMS